MRSAMKKTIRIRRVSSKKELEKAFAIRTRVFVKEQGVPEAIELDRDDRRAWHFLAFVGRRPVGTARIVMRRDRKSTRLNSSHSQISYAVFCLKTKNTSNT